MEDSKVDFDVSGIAEGGKKKTATKAKAKKVEPEESKVDGVGVMEYDLSLPTKGLIYGDAVSIKSMTAKEEDILSNPTFIKKGNVFRELLKVIVVKSPVSTDELLIGDRDYILFNARIDAYGADYDVQIQCPNCNSLQKRSLDISQIDSKELEISPVEPNENLFSYTTSTGEEILFKFFTVELQERYEDYIKKTSKLSRSGVITSRLFYQIVSIGGEEDRGVIRKKVESMRAMESRQLRKFINDHTPTMDMVLHGLDCDQCGYDGEVEIPVGENFFWPDLG